MRSKEQTPSIGETNSKPLNKRKRSMSSGNKFWPSKTKNGRTLEVPIQHAIDATEAHLRALSLINDNEEVTIEFTPTMVRINLTGGKST
jgi:hypothetical protein